MKRDMRRGRQRDNRRTARHRRMERPRLVWRYDTVHRVRLLHPLPLLDLFLCPSARPLHHPPR
jgi:hypothetical protein